MSYKDTLEKCIEYICDEKKSLEKDELWDENSAKLYEELDAYCGAIRGALEVIEYYEGCSAIVKAREGEQFVKYIAM